MKRLIIEKLDGETFAYIESGRHFRQMEEAREADGLKKLPVELLNHECNLDAYGDGTYFVLELK